jgi:hypothetical protein
VGNERRAWEPPEQRPEIGRQREEVRSVIVNIHCRSDHVSSCLCPWWCVLCVSECSALLARKEFGRN